MKSEIEGELEAKEVVGRIQQFYHRQMEFCKFRDQRHLSLRTCRIRMAIVKHRIAPEAFGEEFLTGKQIGQKFNVSACYVYVVEQHVLMALRSFLEKEMTDNPPKPNTVVAMVARLKDQKILPKQEGEE